MHRSRSDLSAYYIRTTNTPRLHLLASIFTKSFFPCSRMLLQAIKFVLRLQLAQGLVSKKHTIACKMSISLEQVNMLACQDPNALDGKIS